MKNQPSITTEEKSELGDRVCICTGKVFQPEIEYHSANCPYRDLDKLLRLQKERLIKEVESIPETAPEYENDAFDNGLKYMKGEVLRRLQGV